MRLKDFFFFNVMWTTLKSFMMTHLLLQVLDNFGFLLHLHLQKFDLETERTKER